MGALGVYVSSLIHRIVKLAAFGLVVGALCFHRELGLLLEGSDRAASAEWYRVTAPSLNSSEIWLNGQRVRQTRHELPALTGKHERVTAPFASIAPASYAFVVVDADAEACR